MRCRVQANDRLDRGLRPLRLGWFSGVSGRPVVAWFMFTSRCLDGLAAQYSVLGEEMPIHASVAPGQSSVGGHLGRLIDGGTRDAATDERQMTMSHAGQHDWLREEKSKARENGSRNYCTVKERPASYLVDREAREGARETREILSATQRLRSRPD